MADSLTVDELAYLQMTELLFQLKARIESSEAREARRDQAFEQLSLTVGRMRSAGDHA